MIIWVWWDGMSRQSSVRLAKWQTRMNVFWGWFCTKVGLGLFLWRTVVTREAYRAVGEGSNIVCNPQCEQCGHWMRIQSERDWEVKERCLGAFYHNSATQNVRLVALWERLQLQVGYILIHLQHTKTFWAFDKTLQLVFMFVWLNKNQKWDWMIFATWVFNLMCKAFMGKTKR